MKTPTPPRDRCGTLTPLTTATLAAREAMLDAVREAKGRRALRPAETVAAAALDAEAFLVVPAWAEGETAADVAAGVLRDVYELDVRAGAAPLAWSLYATAARRLGFSGAVPVPVLDGLSTAAQA